MLALAFGGPSPAFRRFQRRALDAGCVPFHDRETSWLAGAFPAVRTRAGAEWSDQSLEMSLSAAGISFRCATPTLRPLYVMVHADSIFASSSLELLTDVFRPSLSAKGLSACVVGLGVVSQTAFEGIERLGPGTHRYGEQRRHSEVPVPPDVDRSGLSLRASADALRGGIDRAVTRALPAHGKIALFLSGGLDSSAILASLAEHVSTERIVLVTWALAERTADRPFVEAWQDRLGIPVHAVTAADCAPLVDSSLVLGGRPMLLMTGAFERCAMRRARELGACMVLTGVGGDEAFSGALQAAVRDAAAGGLLGQVRRALLAELPWTGTSLERLSELVVRPHLRRVLPSSVRRALFAARATSELPVETPRLREAVRDAARMHVDALPAVPRTVADRWREAVQRPFWFEMSELRAQLEASEGLPRFDVPLDAELHQLLASLAPEHLFAEHRHRGLLRFVLQGRAPQVAVARTQKADFESFALEMLRRAGIRQRWAELAEARALHRLGIAPRGGLRGVWQDPTRDQRALEGLMPLFPFLSAEAFAQEMS